MLTQSVDKVSRKLLACRLSVLRTTCSVPCTRSVYSMLFRSMLPLLNSKMHNTTRGEALVTNGKVLDVDAVGAPGDARLSCDRGVAESRRRDPACFLSALCTAFELQVCLTQAHFWHSLEMRFLCSISKYKTRDITEINVCWHNKLGIGLLIININSRSRYTACLTSL